MKSILYFLTLLVLGLIPLGCTKKTPPPTEQLTAEQLGQRGKSIYKLNCIACHNADPNKDGTTGPAVYGASLELLQTKLLNATYPAGYKSKRESKLMPKLPHLENEIQALHKFLNP